jgi:hypothetical protein
MEESNERRKSSDHLWYIGMPDTINHLISRHMSPYNMWRQPLIELFDNIYYNCTVYTDVLE